MAVVLRRGADPKYWYTFQLETFDPADDARIQAGGDWLHAEEIAYMEETEDYKKLGFRMAERPWRAEFLPQKLQLSEGSDLPDFINAFPGCSNKYANGKMVSPRLKALIETHQTDEDGWQFFPVEILNKDGSALGTYYIWWVHKVVDGLDESSEGVKSAGGGVLRAKHSQGMEEAGMTSFEAESVWSEV
ncbi:MAG: hypothetical protein P8X76_05495 [Maritimibacter sp.]